MRERNQKLTGGENGRKIGTARRRDNEGYEMKLSQQCGYGILSGAPTWRFCVARGPARRAYRRNNSHQSGCIFPMAK